MDYYRKKISQYFENKGYLFVDIKKKCSKLVHKLFFHNKIYDKYYNNYQWWFYLGHYYQEQRNYDNMIKYYLIAIDKGDSNSMYTLGNYFYKQQDYDNMMKYYLQLINVIVLR